MYNFNIMLTEMCNANCSHCYMRTDKILKKKSLSKEDINVIVKKMPINTSTVVLTGGEIFLVKDILEYSIKLIKKINPNICIGLESNGIYLYNNLKHCREELKKLKEMGVSFIRFSEDPFHEEGGVNLTEVRKLKKLENNQTPIIKFLTQNKAVPIGRAKKLSENSISHSNCMNKELTKDNPYLFLDIDGNVFTCAWKCIPSVGNILIDDWETIVKNLSNNSNQLILIGKIEDAISNLTGKNKEELKKKSKKNGQCSLCIENFDDNWR